MKVAICEDDHDQIAVLREYVGTWSQARNIAVEISEFNSAESCLFAWTAAGIYDILFLDIRLKNMTGIELARVIRAVDQDTPIVLTTASMEFALEGYDVNVMKYLLKPVEERDIHVCLDRAQEVLDVQKEDTFLVTTGGKHLRFKYSEIYYFESFAHTLSMKTTKGEVRFRRKIEDAEAELVEHDQFVRSHRSYIINLDHVSSLEKGSATFDDGTVLPVSRERWRETSAAFVAYHTKQL